MDTCTAHVHLFAGGTEKHESANEGSFSSEAIVSNSKKRRLESVRSGDDKPNAILTVHLRAKLKYYISE